MKGTYISVGIMTVLVVAAVVYGFMVGGSPWAVRGYKLDDTRISDFSTIQNAIQEFYNSSYSRLPQSLGELASSTSGMYAAEQNAFTDPETQQIFDYKVVNATSYQLCATFAASSQEESQNDNNDYVDYPVGMSGSYSNQHPAGYYCFTYSVSVPAPVSGTSAVY